MQPQLLLGLVWILEPKVEPQLRSFEDNLAQCSFRKRCHTFG